MFSACTMRRSRGDTIYCKPERSFDRKKFRTLKDQKPADLTSVTITLIALPQASEPTARNVELRSVCECVATGQRRAANRVTRLSFNPKVHANLPRPKALFARVLWQGEPCRRHVPASNGDSVL